MNHKSPVFSLKLYIIIVSIFNYFTCQTIKYNKFRISAFTSNFRRISSLARKPMPISDKITIVHAQT